ncbi:hypothetical protein M0R45_016788 [Rubus argutus]|uniref:Uncharacterized protein n=1 Tax=Rubus argutus TaxID=59490 RepID=A0AAW1XUB6_RUBAR
MPNPPNPETLTLMDERSGMDSMECFLSTVRRVLSLSYTLPEIIRQNNHGAIESVGHFLNVSGSLTSGAWVESLPAMEDCEEWDCIPITRLVDLCAKEGLPLHKTGSWVFCGAPNDCFQDLFLARLGTANLCLRSQ